MDPLIALLLALYGLAVSWIQERFGAFQTLEPRTKQLINSIFAFIIPVIVTYGVAPWWRADFGDPTEAVTALLVLLAPVGVWLASQAGHYLDKWLEKITAR